MTGAQALQARLHALVLHTARAALASQRAAVEKTAAYARQIVPVRTGRLKSSIAPYEQGDRMEVKVICPYAVYVEMGTRFMAARPYLLPGVRQADYPGLALRAWKEMMK